MWVKRLFLVAFNSLSIHHAIHLESWITVTRQWQRRHSTWQSSQLLLSLAYLYHQRRHRLENQIYPAGTLVHRVSSLGGRTTRKLLSALPVAHSRSHSRWSNSCCRPELNSGMDRQISKQPIFWLQTNYQSYSISEDCEAIWRLTLPSIRISQRLL